jgi:HD-GYP domain-containing protein (c-di-GMP phosphodiesterase class II)
MRVVVLNQDAIGKKLGQKLYNSQGGLLLGKGTEIKEFHFSHIQQVGYKSVYVVDEFEADTDMTGHIISEKTRANTPIELKKIYQKLRSSNKITVSDGKKDLNEVAASLVRQVNYRLETPPDILDLKRQEDYLYQHAINVAAYAILIGQRLRYHQMKLFDLALSALLYDFGMQFIDQEILNKPGELNESEYEEVKKHTDLGFQHLSRKCFMKGVVSAVALQHHERYDGSGYPIGMSGDVIHEYSRIVAVCDFYDAYTSDRPHRQLHSIEDAVGYLKAQSDREFDPNVVRHFMEDFNK